MPKKTYTTLPDRFGICVHDACPVAATCLRNLAYLQMVGDKETFAVVNPRLCSKNKDCRFYRDAAPIRYAKGFTNFQKKMFPEQYSIFKSALIMHFGRSAYFERRSGETLLSPTEQELVISTLRQAGVKEDFIFDEYVELCNWFD